ncbi:MAG: hypothetical protein UW63_C0011G0006 [Candidatus Uhrbacteria bacterium GW2011_GWF2_44_350]|uniref:Uncharacterized protein n=1 Tax=Candidatus Uhrbacteria bacterium GW2011_GWF2_44_350 TaxID=1619000 RepID=A0A0G1JK11_9BACT|nr:MAG: hypothetical protein UW63_C0011G0006 [Candidatus Uhrbacteria bacterium GW2011_GWF2_44_350]HBR80795.1 hypothetical protein [Candidatus Uhrbacteria bacterium]
MKLYLVTILTLLVMATGFGCAKQSNVEEQSTTDWKTYINSICGFSFNYPNDAVIGLDEEKVVGITTQESLNFQDSQEGEVPPFYYINVSCLEDLQTLITNHGDNFDRTKESIKNLEDFFNANTLSVIRYLGQTEVDGFPAFKTVVGIDNSYALWIDRDGVIYQSTTTDFVGGLLVG